jgi:hypothetical protein
MNAFAIVGSARRHLWSRLWGLPRGRRGRKRTDEITLRDRLSWIVDQDRKQSREVAK